MFWDRFRRTPEPRVHAEWADDLAKVEQVVGRAPRGAAMDPMVVVAITGLPLGAVIALLQVLARQQRGRLELRVVDAKGQEIGTYATLGDIPPLVQDEFGDVTRVQPENVELVFRVPP
ncbi:MAG: hypothetical protein ACJ8DC_02365 [Gemmatimonadales bacterium]